MSRLSLYVFGGFRAELDNTPVSGFSSDKVRALLAYLAIESDRAHRRESLTGLFWPDSAPAAARASLSQALFNLHKILKDSALPQPFILGDRDSLRFNRASDHLLDVHALEATDWQDVADSSMLPQLYTGALLDGLELPDCDAFDEWLQLRREALQRLALDAFDRQVERAITRADLRAAIALARRQLEIDPWREETHRHLIRAHALSGQRSDALAQFAQCRQVLNDALGIEPSAATLELVTRIQNDDLSGPATAPPSLPVARPLRVLPLPAPLSTLIGRARELDELTRLLLVDQQRLITLTGLGGVGKTRLALELARATTDAFAQGAAVVPLAALRHAHELPAAIASALGISGEEQQRSLDDLSALIGAARLLLILDNFEHLLVESERAAGLAIIHELLQRTPSLSMIVCSRERLGSQVEQVFALSGLPVAPDATGGSEPAAVALFVQRARQQSHQFQLTPDNRAAVLSICQLLDGLPLGIELAASWAAVLDPGDIARELEHSVDALDNTLRDGPGRQRSLRAVLDQTWRMLPLDVRGALQRLSVFVGGFTREAAQQTAGVSLAQIAALSDKALVQRAPRGRYALHNLVRRYAREQLDASVESDAALRAHAQYCVTQARAAAQQLSGATLAQGLARIDADLADMNAALSWLLDHDAGAALALATHLQRYWEVRGLFREGTVALEMALARAPEATRLRGVALVGLALLGYPASQFERMRSCSAEAITLSRQFGDVHTEAVATLALAWAADALQDVAQAKYSFEQAIALAKSSGDDGLLARAYVTYSKVFREHENDLAGADACLDAALRIYRRAEDPRGLAMALLHQSQIATARGEYGRAVTLAAECVQRLRALDARHELGWALMAHGEALVNAGQAATALPALNDGLRVFEALGADWGVAIAWHHVARALRLAGDLTGAAGLYRRSLQMCEALSRDGMAARCVAGLAAVALAQGQPARALAWLQAALPCLPTDLTPGDLSEYDALLAAATAAQPDGAPALTLQQAIAECLALA